MRNYKKEYAWEKEKYDIIKAKISKELGSELRQKLEKNNKSIASWVTDCAIEYIGGNIMTIKELKEMLTEQGKEYCDIEVYKYNSSRKSIHTDSIDSIDDYTDDDIVEDYELMNEEDYEHSILANSSISADFEAWYDDKNATILVIIIK